MSSASSVLPSDLVSVEVAAQQVGAHPQTSLTRCTFPVLYPVLAPERGPEWQTHARRRNLGRVLRWRESFPQGCNLCLFIFLRTGVTIEADRDDPGTLQ